MKQYQHVLLATDLHNDNDSVIEEAVALAKRNSAKLSVINVLPKIPYYMASGIPSVADLEDHLEEENLRKLKTLEAKIDVEADYHLLHGSPKRKIVSLARELSCDIVVIGSHGRHGVERFIGSTATGVLQRAHCDVLVIRINARKPSQV
ncbi:MAG: universal stress protein [Gammaproteobacteria bacterium]|nr:MAG: universal stress protein [Gammaproteobacteria bacterium]UTW43748.1 universal stress protein [bacterium SCSIO 12844]